MKNGQFLTVWFCHHLSKNRLNEKGNKHLLSYGWVFNNKHSYKLYQFPLSKLKWISIFYLNPITLNSGSDFRWQTGASEFK